MTQESSPVPSSGVATVTILLDDPAVLGGGAGRVRIMPLGDFITAGVSDAIPPDQCVPYRQRLYGELEAISPSYRVDFVGSVTDQGGAV